jgi:hypothetical protein
VPVRRLRVKDDVRFRNWQAEPVTTLEAEALLELDVVVA